MVVDWKIIGELTDKIVLGTEGLSNKEPRKKKAKTEETLKEEEA